MITAEFLGGPLDGEVRDLPQPWPVYRIPRPANGAPLGTPRGFADPEPIAGPPSYGVYRLRTLLGLPVVTGGVHEYEWQGETGERPAKTAGPS